MLEYIIISLAVIVGETIGAIIGGGGFVIQPVLMALHLSIEQSIALCVPASAGTVLSGLMTFNNNNKVQWREALYIIPLSAIGAAIGSYIMPLLSSAVLSGLFLVSAIICTAISWIGKIDIANDGKENALRSAAAAFFSGIIIAIIGAGSGILTLMLIIYLGKKSYVSSLIVRKFIFIPATAVSIIQYANMGLYSADIFMVVFCSAIVAGWLGAKIALKLNSTILTIIFRIATMLLVIGTVIKQFV